MLLPLLPQFWFPFLFSGFHFEISRFPQSSHLILVDDLLLYWVISVMMYDFGGIAIFLLIFDIDNDLYFFGKSLEKNWISDPFLVRIRSHH